MESAVGHAKKTPLKGLRFESLADAQADLDRFEDLLHGPARRIAGLAHHQTKPILIRSLDLIHVASASVAGATGLLTTDARLRELAA